MIMKNFVIVEFPAAAGKLEELEATLKAAAVDTRAFKGCISIAAFIEQGTSTVTMIENWEAMDDYEAYLSWRLEGGLPELLEPLLEGGAGGLVIKRFGAPKDV